MMTMKQIMKQLNENSLDFAKQGNLEKSFACLELAAFIKREGYDKLKGEINLAEGC